MKSSEQISYEQRIQLAIKAYQNDDWNVSKRKLARQHGIAESTLRDRLKGVKPHQIAHVLQQKLTSEQEDALAHWAILMHSWGWPSRVNQLRSMATELLRESGSQEEIGVNWSQKFLQRRPELISVFSQTLNKERAAMHNDQIISA